MSITSLDLKLRQSQRMTDFTDGGGRMSAVEIVDGVTNNVFSDLSDTDGIVGDVSLRKFFLQVATANTDAFLGPMTFLTDLPENANVTVALFDTESATDERAAARSYVESYRISGTKTQLILYGLHVAGQRTVQVFTRPETPSPDIGDVLRLSTEADGYTAAEQYVQVQAILSRVTTTFTDASGDFTFDVLIIQTTSALTGPFYGIEDPERFSSSNHPPTVVRFTQIADSARYYGYKPCTVNPQSGDLIVHVGNPYITITPVQQGATPVVDQLAGLAAVSMIAAGASGALTLAFTATAAAGVGVTRYFGTPYKPGTLALTVDGTSLRDDGHGGVAAVDPSSTGWGGGADYQTGAFTITRDVGFSGSVTAAATPAGAMLKQGYSRALPITASNRVISYVVQLPGQPSPGSITLDFLALGRWIRLTDTGRGQLAGSPGQGVATVNYATGSIAVTLGALPDVGSALVLGWGTDLRAKDSSGTITIPTPTFRQSLDHAGATAGTLAMTWTSGSASKSADADAAGVITGDATGYIDQAAGIVEFATTATPDDAQFHYAYDYVDAAKLHQETFTPTASGHAISITLAHAAAEHSVVATWNRAVTDASGNTHASPWTVIDDGSGGWISAITGTNTIDYATGAIVLTVD